MSNSTLALLNLTASAVIARKVIPTADDRRLLRAVVNFETQETPPVTYGSLQLYKRLEKITSWKIIFLVKIKCYDILT